MVGKARLRGDNRHVRNLDIARSIADQISEDPRVVGVMFLGGLVRGFSDEYSDIDIVVITQRRDWRLKRELEGLGRSAGQAASVDVDLEVHSLMDFDRLEKTDWRRWDYRHSITVLDRGGKVGRIVTKFVKVPDSYWVDRIVKSWMHFQWYGVRTDGIKTIAEMWIERGDPESAHYCLNYSIELLMDLLYALNREFVPAPKWRPFVLRDLPWKPKGLDEALDHALVVKSLDEEDLSRRTCMLKPLHRPLEKKVLRFTGMTQKEIIHHFVKKAVFELE